MILILLLLTMLLAASGVSYLMGVPANPDPENISLNTLRTAQILYQVIGFLVPSLIMLYLIYGNISRASGLSVRPNGVSFTASIFGMIAILPLVGMLALANKHLIDDLFPAELVETFKAVEERPEKLTEMFLRMETPSDLIINLVMVAFLAALCEEIFFRGTLQRILYNGLGVHGAIILTSVLFSFLHFQFYGFIPRFAIGVALGYLFAWTGSLYVPFTAHFVFNGFQVILAYLQQRGTLPENVSSDETLSDSLLVVLMSAVIFSGVLFLVWKHRRPVEKEIYITDEKDPRSAEEGHP